MEKELEFLEDKVVKNPAHPFVAIVGGAKVSSKITVIEKLLEKVDKIIIGGGMAFTFFKAKGLEIGTSMCEEDQIETAKKIVTEKEAIAKVIKKLEESTLFKCPQSNDIANHNKKIIDLLKNDGYLTEEEFLESSIITDFNN